MVEINELNLEEFNPLAGEEKEAPVDSAKLRMLEEMMKAGLFLGHKKAKTHPRMKPYIYTTRNGIEIIDVAKTLESLELALEFVKSKLANNGFIMLVGTTPVAKSVVEEYAKKMNFPYVVERWLGGTLTNFKTLSKRIAYFKKLKADRAAGKFEKYTKKERLDIDRKIAKLSVNFSGIENMEGLPQAVFVVDATHNMIAIKEAKKIGIPIIAMINTDINPEVVDYPVPCNDRVMEGIRWIMEKLSSAVEEAKNLPKN